jgi:ribosome-associated translation inhibitor RaiA
MLIQVNTDHNINGHESLKTGVSATIQDGLSRFSDHITRVEVHLSDSNSNKKRGGNDKRCLIEARMEGLKPVAVTHHAGSIDQATQGAVDKLARLIDNTIGKLRDQRNRAEKPAPEAFEEPEDSFNGR